MDLTREFNTGATRDQDLTKLDLEGFLNPIVIKRFAEYMQKHQKQSDGKIRESDNWQLMFGEKHCDVCIKSLWRHFLDLWMFHRGYKGRDDKEEALCAIMFNTQAYLLKILKDKKYGE